MILTKWSIEYIFNKQYKNSIIFAHTPRQKRTPERQGTTYPCPRLNIYKFAPMYTYSLQMVKVMLVCIMSVSRLYLHNPAKAAVLVPLGAHCKHFTNNTAFSYHGIKLAN